MSERKIYERKTLRGYLLVSPDGTYWSRYPHATKDNKNRIRGIPVHKDGFYTLEEALDQKPITWKIVYLKTTQEFSLLSLDKLPDTDEEAIVALMACGFLIGKDEEEYKVANQAGCTIIHKNQSCHWTMHYMSTLTELPTFIEAARLLIIKDTRSKTAR